MAILIENMRREGYEFSVGRPEVIFKTNKSGQQLEPWEALSIEVPEDLVGVVTTAMGERKAVFKNMRNLKLGVRFEYKISSRNLIGFRSEFQTTTSGLGIVNDRSWTGSPGSRSLSRASSPGRWALSRCTCVSSDVLLKTRARPGRWRLMSVCRKPGALCSCYSDGRASCRERV